jgi:hypothetical protein
MEVAPPGHSVVLAHVEGSWGAAAAQRLFVYMQVGAGEVRRVE